jgi:hypothetical protein
MWVGGDSSCRKTRRTRLRYGVTLGGELPPELPCTLPEQQNGIFALLQALGSVVTLLVMYDRRDLGTTMVAAPAPAGTVQEGQ